MSSATSSGYSWWDFDKVLSKIGWRQTPNHSPGFLTYTNDLNQTLIIMKENNMNLDYFHKLLRQLGIRPSSFATLASDGIHPTK
ncbi:MAG: hypothetical protein WCF23_01220 [Candidatus Nitrosopolaris sp.]